MKFGKTFESHLTSEWRQQYMNYQELKAMIKEAVEEAPDPGESSIIIAHYYSEFEGRFVGALYDELVRVNNFFAHKQAEAQRKLATLQYRVTNVRPRESRARPSMLGIRVQKTPNLYHLHLDISEFYLSLIMLQNYQTLNYTGFRKICKKYDKNMKSEAATNWYRRNVIGAPFTQATLLSSMIGTVEDLYTEYLANGDRSKAMAKLRVPPLGHPTPPVHVFCAALFLGLFIVATLICIISYIALNMTEEFAFMYSHLFRGPAAITFYSFLFVINVRIWERVGVNYVLIFEIDLRNTLGSVRCLEIVSFLGYIFAVANLFYLFHQEFSIKTPLVIPLIYIVFIVALLVNPLKILFHKTRFWLLTHIGRLSLAPFKPICFVDFWIADQWNSVVISFVDHYLILRFYIRYLFGMKNAFLFEPDYAVPIIRAVPSWIRFAQCLRRFWDSDFKNKEYLLNAVKYILNITVVIFSTIQMETMAHYDGIFENPFTWLYCWVYIWTSSYNLGWDLIMDFGLFRIWKGENIFLRENLVYPKWFYYFAIVENTILRFCWLVEFLLVATGVVGPFFGKTMLLFLEIVRRFFWNLLRLENEHLNNCGKFRATRDIFITKLEEFGEPDLERLMDDSTERARSTILLDVDEKKES